MLKFPVWFFFLAPHWLFSATAPPSQADDGILEYGIGQNKGGKVL